MCVVRLLCEDGATAAHVAHNHEIRRFNFFPRYQGDSLCEPPIVIGSRNTARFRTRCTLGQKQKRKKLNDEIVRRGCHSRWANARRESARSNLGGAWCEEAFIRPAARIRFPPPRPCRLRSLERAFALQAKLGEFDPLSRYKGEIDVQNSDSWYVHHGTLA